jgi:hypothetical protein
MNSPVNFSDEGAFFRIAETEYEALDEIAQERHGTSLRELPIGKAASILRIIIMTASQDVIVQDENGVIASTAMDSEEAAYGVLEKVIAPFMKHAVMDVGRLSVRVIKDKEINNKEARPALAFEITSLARKWSDKVLELHSTSLFDNGETVPAITGDILLDMPERGETALALQGLALRSSPELSSNRVQQVEIIRLPEIV